MKSLETRRTIPGSDKFLKNTDAIASDLFPRETAVEGGQNFDWIKDLDLIKKFPKTAALKSVSVSLQLRVHILSSKNNRARAAGPKLCQRAETMTESSQCCVRLSCSGLGGGGGGGSTAGAVEQ